MPTCSLLTASTASNRHWSARQIAEQVSAVLRLCAEADATVTPWGGGTAMALGNPPRQVEVVLNTGRLDRVIDHDPANLTVTAESGISLAALQQLLAAQRQFVPVDPPFPERSTVGGIVAANLNGPRRSYYGSVRDLVIGMKVGLASAANGSKPAAKSSRTSPAMTCANFLSARSAL